MKQTRWVRVDDDLLNRRKVQTEPQPKKSVNIELFVSPYDVPEAMRGFYDRAIKRFVIEFRYISEEPLKSVEEKPCLLVWVGRNSGRIHRIEVDVDGHGADAVELTLGEQIDDAIEELSRSRANRARDDNYAIARQLIRDHAGELFASSL